MFTTARTTLYKSNVFFRTLTTATRVLPSSAYTSPGATQDTSTSSTPQDLTQQERNAIDAALRVDQAGEVAANYIYMGQYAVLGRDRKFGPLIGVSRIVLASGKYGD